MHYAAIYGRKELYNMLLTEFKADKSLVDFSGTKPHHYLGGDTGHGANNKGINKVWQDLAIDVQNYQKQCFDEQQQQRDQKTNKQDQKCFEGIKKRHSLGF